MNCTPRLVKTNRLCDSQGWTIVLDGARESISMGIAQWAQNKQLFKTALAFAWRR